MLDSIKHDIEKMNNISPISILFFFTQVKSKGSFKDFHFFRTFRALMTCYKW